MEIIKLPVRKNELIRRRAAAYARVSMESDDLLHSLANQVSYYTDLISRTPEWELAGIYVDAGITGTSIKKRADFLRMMDDARAGKIDLILTKSISRFARNTVDLLESVRELKELGIEVRFERERINTMTSEGEFLLTILAAFAQAESVSISNNVKWAKRKRIAAGEATVSVACFGYVWNEEEGRLVISGEQAGWVKYIYREYLAGASIKGLTKDLQSKGVRGKRGELISRVTVRRILTSETYTGDLILQRYFSDKVHSVKVNHGEERRVLVKNAHEAIISRQDFEEVQERLRYRADTCDNSGYKKSEYAGYIRCGKCDRTVGLVRRSNHDNDRLECNFRKQGKCDLLPIRTEEFNDLMGRTVHKNEELDYAVIFDDRIEFHLKNREVRSVARSISAKKALSGKIVCGCCGSRFTRMTPRNERIWCCKVRASDRKACRVKSIREDVLLDLAEKTLDHPSDLNMRIYCDIEKIEVCENTVTFHLKEGDRTWQRK